ncbi:tripartite tricarboxylate transporter TctB family protein [Salinivibrio sp. IB872]|uniref:tripartite tricarboxylate transporter TctB family protein n=1 Tax=Salinivibrio sp. IB872 TaxID=1766123 RepID=UPI001F52730D|nr:tripartite tricarboxylate transporter TctB family protein [Salinivibrio sp. IB872]
MTITKDHIGGLIFLSFSLAYSYYANQIALIPGDEFQPFHARTLPNFLAVLGGVLALLQLLTATKSRHSRLSLTGYDFWLMGKLLLLMVAFSLALKWVGFLVSTALFLSGGYWLLGERRPKVILLAAASQSHSLGVSPFCYQLLVFIDSNARYLSGTRSTFSPSPRRVSDV